MSSRPTAIETIRDDFPLISGRSTRDELVYLDNAASTQKPNQVLHALHHYYAEVNANVHRGVHTLSDEATAVFEAARETVTQFVHARSPNEIIWTRGTTESINLVANCFSERYLNSGDVILVSELEHHSNIVPWQMAAQRREAVIKAVRIGADGCLDLSHFKSLLDERVKLVALTHVSNALGSISPLAEITQLSRDVGAFVLIDGAQAAPHLAIDVQQLDCDFYTFSGHKLYGPTGIGVLYGKESVLASLPPWQGGGEMIEKVTFEETTYQGLPYRFEAGTPNIAGAVGLASAIDYLSQFKREDLLAHENDLLSYATSRLNQIEGVRIVGPPGTKGPIISFLLANSHPHDVGTLLNNQGIAVRTGHHCAMPLMAALDIPGTIRASFAIYNSRTEVDQFVGAVEKTRAMLM